MKYMKKMLSVLICLVILSSAMMVGAADASLSQGSVSSIADLSVPEDFEYTESFVQKIHQLFQNKENYEVFDANGNDVTNAFYSEYTQVYESGDYGTIIYGLSHDDLMFAESTIYIAGSPNAGSENVLQPMLTVSNSAKKSFTKTFTVLNSSFYLTYSAVGSFKVNDYTFEILSATPASLQSVASSDIFQKHPGTTLRWVNEEKNTPVIKTPNPSNPSNKTVTFSGTADLQVLVPSISLPRTIAGFGKYSFTANGQGTVIS